MLLAITPPADNERGPIYAEHLLTALHHANTDRVPVTLAFGTHDGQRIGLHCGCTDSNVAELIRDQVLAHYDGSRITELSDDALTPAGTDITAVQELCVRPDVFPIRRHSQFRDESNHSAADPLTTILATLASANRSGLHTIVEIVVVPVRGWRRRHARNAIERLASPFFRTHRALARLYATGVSSRYLLVRSITRLLGCCASGGGLAGRGDPLSTSVSRTHEREDDLQAATAKVNGHLFEARIRVRVSANSQQAHVAPHALRSVVSAFGQFKGLAAFVRTRRPRASLLSAEELAGIWHCPLATVKAPKMDSSLGRTFESPPDVPLLNDEPNLAVLGRVYHHRLGGVTGLRIDDRYRHVAIVGKSGTGKSTLLQNLIASDMRQGRGVALIDPHGDLADTVLSLVPRSRTNDVVLFDAGDRGYPIAFNPLAVRTEEQRTATASGVLAAFKKMYGGSWGPRTEHILRNCLLALLDTPGTTLVSLMQLLSDAAFRRHIVARVRDPAVRAFWLHEFAGWNAKFRTEAIAPIQNKVGQFVTHPIIRGIIGQPKSTLDLRGIMDDGNILIARLPKAVGEDVSGLLGSLLVSALQIAAMSRADQREGERRPFFVYIDEFQNFATESFATILSEARKYRAPILTLANQYLDQLDDATRDAVFGNVGSLVSFQVGPQDAEILSRQLAGGVRPDDLITAAKHTAYVRLLIDGMPSKPFTIRTLSPPPIHPRTRRSDRVRNVSRRRYSRPIERVEREISSAFGVHSV